MAARARRGEAWNAEGGATAGGGRIDGEARLRGASSQREGLGGFRG